MVKSNTIQAHENHEKYWRAGMYSGIEGFRVGQVSAQSHSLTLFGSLVRKTSTQFP